MVYKTYVAVYGDVESDNRADVPVIGSYFISSGTQKKDSWSVYQIVQLYQFRLQCS